MSNRSCNFSGKARALWVGFNVNYESSPYPGHGMGVINYGKPQFLECPNFNLPPCSQKTLPEQKLPFGKKSGASNRPKLCFAGLLSGILVPGIEFCATSLQRERGPKTPAGSIQQQSQTKSTAKTAPEGRRPDANLLRFQSCSKSGLHDGAPDWIT